MARFQLCLLLGLFTAWNGFTPAHAAAPPPAVSLAHGSEEERATEDVLRQLFKRYDVARWTFTDRLVIDRDVGIPFSHPVLTLSPKDRADPMMLLSVFLHENQHWWLEANEAATNAAITDLKKIYPNVPVGGGKGAQSEYSSYLHLINCWLEIDALQDVAGRDVAARILGRLTTHHYTWIYERIRDDNARIAAIVREHGLIPSEVAAKAT